ncbi:MAG: protein BatD [Lewinellaceae bacterium]|nr:protein BatD [Phaeodactylibacter sp.]MCB9347500.1 protein BatD [Lewinellaceae bacterium]
MFRTLLISVVVMVAPLFLQGQAGVSFEAATDARSVVLESYFDVDFTLSNADGSNFQPPPFKDFIVVSGPSSSVQTTMINGQVSKRVGYIYTLKPRRLGRLMIGSATIQVKGRTLRTAPIGIEVVKSQPGAGGEDVFIAAEPSTTEAWIGQQIILDYKLYTTVDVESFNILEEADYQGFYARDIRRYDGRIIRETLNGKQYVTKILKRVALFPQQAGSLKISPINVQLGLLKKEEGRRRGFFFTPEVKRVPVSTKSLTIQVSPLPDNPPPSFSGGVGEFGMISTFNRATLTTDDALSLTITINGSGDIKRVQAPALVAPPSFELYDPKVAEESSFESGGGITGKKVFEYLMLPKEAGAFKLQPSFTYFDPDSARYITINPTVYDITVRPGSGRSQSRNPGNEDGLVKSEDIDVLMPDQALYPQRPPFLGSALFWLLALLPALALGGIIVFKSWRARRADIDPTLLRSRRARKVAQQRLATAQQHLNAGSTRAFYDEVSKAMLGYICDKLHIARSSLSKANLQHRLEQLQLDQSLISRFMATIQTCEMALFAGQDDAAAMQDTYQAAVQVLSDIEGGLSQKV